MSNTFNLFALDVFSSAIRQLNIIVENGENRLLVSDNKQTDKLEEVRVELEEIKHTIISVSPTLYSPHSLLETMTFATGDKSHMCDVARVKSVNVFYKDAVGLETGTPFNADYTVTVFGRIGGSYKELTETITNSSGDDEVVPLTIFNKQNIDLVEDYVDAVDTGGYDVELTSFTFKKTSDNRTNTNNRFTITSLNVEGMSKLYLTTTMTDGTNSSGNSNGVIRSTGDTEVYISSQF